MDVFILVELWFNELYHPCLVEAVPEFYELLKYRNRNATTIMTCLAVEKRPHVRFVLILRARQQCVSLM